MLTIPFPPAAVVVLALVLGATTAVTTGPLLRRLPSSAPSPSALVPLGTATGPDPAAPDVDRPPDYAALATGRFALGCGGVAAVASLLVLLLAPWPWLPLWLVWSTLFAVLVAVDAATTWLPLSLTHWTWASGALAVAVPAVLAVVGGPATPGDLGRTLLGATAAALMYGGLWRFGNGLGFGDVRISPLLGALGATLSWSGWWVAMVAGPLLGALWGVARTATGRRGPYAYGPWMWLGPAAALVAQATGPVGA